MQRPSDTVVVLRGVFALVNRLALTDILARHDEQLIAMPACLCCGNHARCRALTSDERGDFRAVFV